MNTKERHEMENESIETREDNLEANRLRADARNRKRENTKKINKLWLWLGVLILIAILLYWLFGIGMAEDLSGVSNG